MVPMLTDKEHKLHLMYTIVHQVASVLKLITPIAREHKILAHKHV